MPPQHPSRSPDLQGRCGSSSAKSSRHSPQRRTYADAMPPGNAVLDKKALIFHNIARSAFWTKLGRAAPARPTSPSASGWPLAEGFSVGFVTAAALVHELLEATDERRLLRLQTQLAACKLLIVDELGYVPLPPRRGELLFEVLQPALRAGLGPGHQRPAVRQNGPPCSARSGSPVASRPAPPPRPHPRDERREATGLRGSSRRARPTGDPNQHHLTGRSPEQLPKDPHTSAGWYRFPSASRYAIDPAFTPRAMTTRSANMAMYEAAEATTPSIRQVVVPLCRSIAAAMASPAGADHLESLWRLSPQHSQIASLFQIRTLWRSLVRFCRKVTIVFTGLPAFRPLGPGSSISRTGLSRK